MCSGTYYLTPPSAGVFISISVWKIILLSCATFEVSGKTHTIYTFLTFHYAMSHVACADEIIGVVV